MKKLLILPLLLLTACGGGAKFVSANPEGHPVYCIRGVEVVGDGTVMLDMPGLYFGQDDKPMKVSVEVAESLNAPTCKPGDPRLASLEDIQSELRQALRPAPLPPGSKNG